MINRPGRQKKRNAVHRRIRKRIKGTAERPRLAFFKSARHVYAQLVDDDAGRTLVSASTLHKSLKGKVARSGNVAAAKAVGELFAEQALQKKITTAVFDRGGFLYHGAVKAFADAAREKGLKF